MWNNIQRKWLEIMAGLGSPRAKICSRAPGTRPPPPPPQPMPVNDVWTLLPPSFHQVQWTQQTALLCQSGHLGQGFKHLLQQYVPAIYSTCMMHYGICYINNNDQVICPQPGMNPQMWIALIFIISSKHRVCVIMCVVKSMLKRLKSSNAFPFRGLQQYPRSKCSSENMWWGTGRN